MKEIWLKKTKQGWKVNLGFLLMLTALGHFGAMFLSINEVGIFKTFSTSDLSFRFIVLTIISWVWLSNAIKCPECGYKPVWNLVKNLPSNEWCMALFKMEECHSCVAKKKGGLRVALEERVRIFEADESEVPRPLEITVVSLFSIVFLLVMLAYKIMGILEVIPMESFLDLNSLILLFINMYWLVCALGTLRLKDWARKGMTIAPVIFIVSALFNFLKYDDVLKIATAIWILLLILSIVFYKKNKVKSYFQS